MVIYCASEIEFPSGLSDKDGSSLLKFVKVGEKGECHRTYTACCGTTMTNALFGRWVAFNRNCVKNPDGTPYKAPADVPNVKVKWAFDPEKVPGPKVQIVHPILMAKIVGQMVNPLSPSLFNRYPELLGDPDEAEMVPITWE